MAVPASSQPSDEQLMLRVRADDADAFERLYDRYVAVALRVARSVCFDAGRAEEAVQEGFLSIWRSRSSYRPGAGSVKAWALTIVRNRAIDAVRRDANDRGAQAGELESETADTRGPSVVDAAVASGEGDALRGFMARLPAAQAEVIALAFFGGLTHCEIAERLSLPEGTVKGRMRLGMHKLRADLEERDAPGPTEPRSSPS
jgi:RNA polymerase sigma-70 factor, ECF subfamily